MNDIVYKALNSALVLLEFGIFSMFASLILVKRDGIATKLLCAIPICVHFFCIALLENTILINIVSYLVTFVMYEVLMYAGNWKSYLLALIYYYLQHFIVEILFYTIMSILKMAKNIAQEASTEYNLSIFVVLLIMRTISIFIYLFIRHRQKSGKEHKPHYGLLVIPMLSTILITVVYVHYWPKQDDDINTLLAIFSVFQFILIIYIFSYFSIWKKSTDRYYRLKESYESQRVLFLTLSKIQRAIQKMGHDIRQHWLYLMNALEEENIPKAKDYLYELDKSLLNLKPIVITGNLDVDAILYGKTAAAQRQGVEIKVYGELPADLAMSAIDLSALLGNAIDNAVEAASHIGIRQNKEIKVVVGYSNNRLNLIVENPYRDKPKTKANGLYFSLKPVGGLGLEIIREVAKKYGGAFDASFGERCFRLTVMLPLPETECGKHLATQGREDKKDDPLSYKAL